jgi:hypothetical protein
LIGGQKVPYFACFFHCHRQSRQSSQSEGDKIGVKNKNNATQPAGGKFFVLPFLSPSVIGVFGVIGGMLRKCKQNQAKISRQSNFSIGVNWRLTRCCENFECVRGRHSVCWGA